LSGLCQQVGQALSGLKNIFTESQSIKDIILEMMPKLKELGLASTNSAIGLEGSDGILVN